MRIIVTHGACGCESGCCGHWVSVDGRDFGFRFRHPYRDQDLREFIRQIVTDACGEDHVKDIDFDNCTVVDD